MPPTPKGEVERRREERDVQLIWVHCDDRREGERIAESCRQQQKRRMVPEELTEAEVEAALSLLQCQRPAVPAVYGGSLEEFLADAAVLLAASAATLSSSGRVRASRLRPELRRPLGEASASGGGAPPPRWPALLVTDRHRLFQSSLDPVVRQVLAETGQFAVAAVLNVVLACDFGHLSGFVVDGPLVPVMRSFGFWEPPLEGRSVPLGRTVELKAGVFLQHYTVGEEREGQERLFGARCVALFEDGRGAYSAVSPDGVRAVEAYGTWQVINGHVIITGGAKVLHLELRGSQAKVRDTKYQEPVYLALQDLASDFEEPCSLAECVPRGGERLRLLLAEQRAPPPPPPEGRTPTPRGSQQVVAELRQEGPRFDGNFTLRPPPAAARRGVPASDSMDGTFGSKWETTFGSSRRTTKGTQEDTLMHTSVHALLNLAGLEAKTPQPAEAGPEVGPRLFGFQRGLTVSAADWALAAETERTAAATPSSPSGAPAGAAPPDVPPEPPSPTMQRLVELAAAESERSGSRRASAAGVREFMTCPLRPGNYHFERGSQEEYSHCKVDLTLHADGSCDYDEAAPNSSLRSVSGNATWQVEDGLLVLRGRRPELQAFWLSEAKGHRSIRRQVERVELSVRLLLQKCDFQPFPQQIEPFPGHEPKDASGLVFGLVDPSSPVLSGMKCRPDRLPYHAFEEALRRHGLPVDEILSDFHFLDRDEDGQVSVADLRVLEDYGSPLASPELLHELREALVGRYGTLNAAFQALQALAAPSGQVTEAVFEKFLAQAAAEPAPPPGEPPKLQLREWAEKTTPEDRKEVFASFNPNKGPSIDLDDFMSLNLHTAVLAVRRLAHFRSWIFENFGNTPDVFREVFTALDLEKKKVLTRKSFADGAQHLGYPCGDKATRSMFSLLDRNFDGEVSVRDFQKVREFSGEDVLKQLDALKRFVDEKMGGVDACYKKLLEKERAVQNISSLPKVASFDAVQKALSVAGFAKDMPDVDLKVLFLFICEAAGKQPNGYVAQNDWLLLKGLGSRALTGSPARLRRILASKYGSMEQAFERMHTSWMKRALVKGLKQTALAGLARSLVALSEAPPPPPSRPGSNRSARSVRTPGLPPRSASAASGAGRLTPRLTPSAKPRRPSGLPTGCDKAASSLPSSQGSARDGSAGSRRHSLVCALPRPPAPRNLSGASDWIRPGPVSAIDWVLA